MKKCIQVLNTIFSSSIKKADKHAQTVIYTQNKHKNSSFVCFNQLNKLFYYIIILYYLNHFHHDSYVFLESYHLFLISIVLKMA